MKNAHPIEVAAALLLPLCRALLVHTIALALLLIRWRPAPPPAAPIVHPLAAMAEPVVMQLQPLTVATLRRRARSAGLPRQLHHRGRRAALLAALAGLEVAAWS